MDNLVALLLWVYLIIGLGVYISWLDSNDKAPIIIKVMALPFLMGLYPMAIGFFIYRKL